MAKIQVTQESIRELGNILMADSEYVSGLLSGSYILYGLPAGKSAGKNEYKFTLQRPTDRINKPGAVVIFNSKELAQLTLLGRQARKHKQIGGFRQILAVQMQRKCEKINKLL